MDDWAIVAVVVGLLMVLNKLNGFGWPWEWLARYVDSDADREQDGKRKRSDAARKGAETKAWLRAHRAQHARDLRAGLGPESAESWFMQGDSLVCTNCASPEGSP